MADPAPQIAQLNKAVEFAHYLANGAERLIEAANARDLLQMRIDEGEETEEDLDALLAGAQETVSEFTRGLRGRIYEFRKRAERIESGPKAIVVERSPPAVASAAIVAKPQAAGSGEIVTYWLYCGEELVATKRLPAGTDDGAVRYAALAEAAIMCDRTNGETPHSRQVKILNSTVRVLDDRPAQERSRRTIPFEYRALFPNELPFLELAFQSREAENAAEVHVRDIAMGLQNVALSEGLEASFKASDGAQRLVHVESEDREAIGRVELSLKAYLADRGAELVSEFGVGYLRVEPVETEPEMERPRG